MLSGKVRTNSEGSSHPMLLFYAYSRKDEKLRDQLETHLSTLRREGVLAGWHDRKVIPGAEWEAAIGRSLEDARIILLLVSADFIASPYCYGVEMQRALERHEAGEAHVIPIILRPCDWKPLLGHLQALPQDGKPITEWRNRDAAWLSVVRGIRRVAEEFLSQTHEPNASNPWPERVLQALAGEQQEFEDERLTGITDDALIMSLAVEPGTEDFMGASEGVDQLEAAGLIERWGDSHLRLTTAGWKQALGSVPGAEQDEEFLEAAVAAYRDPEARKIQSDLLVGSEIFARLNWSPSATRLMTTAERLEEQGLLDCRSSQNEVFLKPTYQALRRFPA